MERKKNNDRRGAKTEKEPQIKILTGSYISGGFGEGVEPANLNPDRKRIANPPKIDFDSSSDDDDTSAIREPLPMVIAVEIMDFTVRRVLFNPTNCADILHWSTFQKLGLPLSMLKPYSGTLEDVFGCKMEIKGYVDLKTTFGEGENTDSINIRYLVTDPKCTPYNIIIGRPSIMELSGGVFSMARFKVKYPRPDGKIGVIKIDIDSARECFKQCF